MTIAWGEIWFWVVILFEFSLPFIMVGIVIAAPFVLLALMIGRLRRSTR